MGFVADLATGILGEEDQRAENPFDVLANTAQDPEKLFKSSLSMASLFTGAGDGLDVVGGITGVDQFSGTDLSGGERWLALLGIGAIGLAVAGGAAMSGMGASPALLLNSGRRETTQWNVNLPTEHPTGPGVLASTSSRAGGTPGPQPDPVVGAEPSQFPLRLADESGAAEGRVMFSGDPEGPMSTVSQHHGSLDDPNRVFESTGQFTNNVLKVDTSVNPTMGYDGFRKLAEDTIDPAMPYDPMVLGRTEIFLRTLGARLLDEVPAFRTMAARLADGSMESDADPALLVAAWVVARWDYAGNLNGMPQSPFRLEGKLGADIMADWKKIREGEKLSPEAEARLGQAMVDFQTATSWMTHPELFINPVVALSHINLDTPGLPQMGLMVLEFDHIPIEKMSTIEVANRIKNMIQLHPSGLVGLITDNFRMLLDRALEGDTTALVELRNTTLGSSLEGKGLLHLDQGASRVRGTPQESLIRNNRNWYSNARKEVEKVSTDLGELPGGSGVSRHLDTWDDDDGIKYIASVAAILSDGEMWETNIKKADQVIRVMRANPDATLEELHKILTTPGSITPRHGFVNAPSGESWAETLADALNNANWIDKVRDFMNTDNDPHVAMRILENQLHIKRNELLNLSPDMSHARRYGPMDEIAAAEKVFIDTVRQEIYYRTQKTLKDLGYGEVVTLYRGTGRAGAALPSDTTKALYPTSHRQSVAEHHGHHNRPDPSQDPELLQFEVAREDILTSMDANIAWSDAQHKSKTYWYEEEVQLTGADIATRTNVRKRKFTGPEHGAFNVPVGHTRAGTWEDVQLNYDDFVISQGDKIHMRQLRMIKLLEGVDDPLEIFETGRAGGLTGSEISAQISAGADLRHLAKQRALSAPWASQKQGLFAHSIFYSTDYDRDEQVKYLAQMMAGKGGWDGLKGERVPHENLRKKLPGVADRQIHKAGVGLSVNPPHAYAEHRFGSDQFAHALAVVAGEIGEVDGVQVLPIEVQAIVWDQLRRMTGVTGPDGAPWPKGTDRTVAMGQSTGYRRPREGSGAGWTEGHGPDVQFSSSFLEWITGAVTSGLPLMRVADEGTDLTRYEGDLAKISYPEEGKPASWGAGPGRKIRFEIAQDGTAKLLTDGVSPRRNRYPSLIKHNGSNVLLNREPQQVGDVDAEFDRVAETTRSFDDPNKPAVLNARVHGATDELPGLMEGPMMQITARTSTDGDGVPDHVAGHRATSRLLKENGIEHEVIDLNPHADKTVVYHDDTRPELGTVGDAAKAEEVFGPGFEQFRTTKDETRQARVFVFKTSDDMQRAAELLHARDENVPGEPMARGATRESAQSELDASISEDARFGAAHRTTRSFEAAERLDTANYNFHLIDQIEAAATADLQIAVAKAQKKLDTILSRKQSKVGASERVIDVGNAKIRRLQNETPQTAEEMTARRLKVEAATKEVLELRSVQVDDIKKFNKARDIAKKELEDLEAQIDDDAGTSAHDRIRHELEEAYRNQDLKRFRLDRASSDAHKEFNVQKDKRDDATAMWKSLDDQYNTAKKDGAPQEELDKLSDMAEDAWKRSREAQKKAIAASEAAQKATRATMEMDLRGEDDLIEVTMKIHNELANHFQDVEDTFQYDKHKKALKGPYEQARKILDDTRKRGLHLQYKKQKALDDHRDLLKTYKLTRDRIFDEINQIASLSPDGSKYVANNKKDAPRLRKKIQEMVQVDKKQQKSVADVKDVFSKIAKEHDELIVTDLPKAEQGEADELVKWKTALATYRRESDYDNIPAYDPEVQRLENTYSIKKKEHAAEITKSDDDDIQNIDDIGDAQNRLDNLSDPTDIADATLELERIVYAGNNQRQQNRYSLDMHSVRAAEAEEALYRGRAAVGQRGPAIAPGGETFDRNIDSNYRDDTPDVVYYADEDGASPKGSVGVWEHHTTDTSGRKLVVTSRSGGPNTPHALKVFVEPGARNLGGELRGRISGRLEPSGRGDHLLTGGEDGTPMQFDGRVNVEPAGEQKIVSKGKDVGRGPFDVEVDGERPTQLVLYIPPPGQPGLPIMAYNDEGLELLQGMHGRERVVTVTESDVQVKTPDSKGKIKRAAYVYDQAQRGVQGERRGDMMLAQQVETLLASISTVPANGRRILPEANRTPKRRSTGPKPAKKKGV